MRWQSLGGGPIVGDVSAGRNADGRIEVFALFADGSLNHIWQLSPGGSWSTWAPLGVDFVSPPVVASNADGRLDFADFLLMAGQFGKTSADADFNSQCDLDHAQESRPRS